MKKSYLFLLLAMILPPIATAVSFAGGMNKPKDAQVEVPANFAVTYSNKVPVSDRLAIRVYGARVTIVVDPTLVGEAKVEVRAHADAIDMKLEANELSFQPRRDADVDGTEIRIELPAEFASLSLEIGGGRCDFEAAHLTADELNVASLGGSVSLDTKELKARRVETSAKGGKLVWKVGSFAFVPGEGAEWSTESQAAQVEIELAEAPAMAPALTTSMGSITLRRGEDTIRAEGLNDSQTPEAQGGAPALVLKAQAGKIEFAINRQL